MMCQWLKITFLYRMRIIFLLVLTCLVGSMVAQPENNHCEDAIAIPADNWCSEIRAYTIYDATPSITEGRTCTGDEDSQMKDVWFEFTALGNFVFLGVNVLEVPVADQPRLFTITLYTGDCKQKISERCVIGNVDVHWIIGDDFVEGETYLARVATSVDSLRPENAALDSLGNFGICLDSYSDSLICSTLAVDALGDTLIDRGSSARLFATATSDSVFVNYQWMVGDSLICDNCPELEVSPDISTLYTVLADDGRCKGQDQIMVHVGLTESDRQVFIPNAFSPNGDQINDRVTIYGGPFLASIKQIDIYNRWGALLFTQKNFPPNALLNGWDGTKDGKPMPMGVFTYVAQVAFIDGSVRQYSGTFHLIR